QRTASCRSAPSRSLYVWCMQNPHPLSPCIISVVAWVVNCRVVGLGNPIRWSCICVSMSQLKKAFGWSSDNPMILVTGGAGYIGSHFIKTYLARYPGETVLVVDNLSEGHIEALSFSPDIRFFQENIGNVEAMTRILTEQPCEAVVHFAAYCYVGESQQQPSK